MKIVQCSSELKTHKLATLQSAQNTWASTIAEVDNGIYTEITASSYSKWYFCLEECMGNARASQCLIGFLP